MGQWRNEVEVRHFVLMGLIDETVVWLVTWNHISHACRHVAARPLKGRLHNPSYSASTAVALGEPAERHLYSINHRSMAMKKETIEVVQYKYRPNTSPMKVLGDDGPNNEYGFLPFHPSYNTMWSF